MNTRVPKNVTIWNTTIEQLRRNIRSPSSRRLSNGRARRSSILTKVTSSATATRPLETTGQDAQPSVGPEPTEKSSRPRPRPPVIAPPRSNPPSLGSRCSARNKQAEHEDGGAERDVDREDPAPRRPGDERPADDRCGGRGDHGDPGDEPRHVDPGLGRVGPVEHRHADRDHHPAPGTLQHPHRRPARRDWWTRRTGPRRG